MAVAGAIRGGLRYRLVRTRSRDDATMILYPAIDLKDGRCVRLKRGEMAEATVFNDDPAAQARSFAAQGFSHLHIVDLMGGLRRQACQRGGRRGYLVGRDAGSARRRHSHARHHRDVAGQRRPPRAQSRRDRSLCANAGGSPATPLASTPGPAGGGGGLGRGDEPTPPSWRAGSKLPGCRRHLHRHRPRRRSVGPQPAGHLQLARAISIPSSPRAAGRTGREACCRWRIAAGAIARARSDRRLMQGGARPDRRGSTCSPLIARS